MGLNEIQLSQAPVICDEALIPLIAISLFSAGGEAARAVHLDVWVHVDVANRLDSGYFDVNAGVPITPMDRALGWDFQEFDREPLLRKQSGLLRRIQFESWGQRFAGRKFGRDSTHLGLAVLERKRVPSLSAPCPPAKPSRSISAPTPVVIGTGTGAQPGFTLQQVASGTAEGFLHIHVNAIIGGGPSGVPTDGIYIFQEQLTTNAPGVTNSLPFWVVFNNNITEDQRGEAINFLYPNQWCGPLGGSYNTDANWSGTIPLPGQIVPVPQSPNGVDAVANLLDNLYSDSTITLDSPATVGTINFKSVPRYTSGRAEQLDAPK